MGIIDMDGFRSQKQFLCKEVGLLKVDEDTDAKKDTRSCRYVKKHIHKLPLGVPYGTMAYPIEALEELVLKFYEGIKKNGTLAYKGGIFERDLLIRNSFSKPGVFRSPKADALVWLETCGNRTELNAYHHCAKVEVEAFGHWLTNQVH